MCEEPREATKTDAPPSNIPGNPTPGIPVNRYSRTVDEDQERPPFPPRDVGPLIEVDARRALTKNDAYTVAVAFVEAWIYKYGPPKTSISVKGKQFAAKFFQTVCSLLGISNIFSSTYHPQTNGQVETYNRTILGMLRNYVDEHQNDWVRYATALAYSYNCHVHRSTNTTRFNLVLSRPAPKFSLYHSVKLRTPPTAERNNDYAKRLEDVIQTAYSRLRKTQRRYRGDFDQRMKKIRRNIRDGDYV